MRFVALLLCLGCSRPYYHGPVELLGLKGVNHLDTHGLSPSELHARMSLAREAGVQVSRGPDIADWMVPGYAEWLRDKILIVQQAGIAPVPILHAPDPPTDAAWTGFLRGVYHSVLLPTGVESVSILNEPDGESWMTPGLYAGWLKIARSELPGITIHAPSVGHGKHVPALDIIAALDPDDYDVLTIHPYNRGWTYVRQCLAAAPGKPVWIEEDGDTGLFRESALRGSYHEYLAHPRIKAVLWYCWDNPDDRAYSMAPDGRPNGLFSAFAGVK